MNYKRIIGLILIILGVALFFFANYEKERIAAAQVKINEQLNQGNKLFQGNPIEEYVGKAVTGSMKNQAAGEIAKYQQQILWCQYGGIALILIGAAMVIFCKCKRK